MARFKVKIAGADSNNLAHYGKLAQAVAEGGFDAMSCGALSELTQDQMADPDDSWVRFTAMGAGLMKFVETELVNGVLSTSHIEKNAALLAEKSKILERYGLWGQMRLLEPQWLPERFWQEHPTLRGPRVDHPGVARGKYYSPCLDRAEVLAHYREGIRRLLEIAPRVRFLTLWGNDSGGGICWCKGLYPGVNGPDGCRAVPMGKRIRKWLLSINAGARDAGGRVEINFDPHGFGRNDMLEIIAALPKNARASLGTGPFPNDPFIYPEAAVLIDASNRAGRPACISLDPTLSYPLGPLVDPPVVYFIFDSVGEAARSGAGGGLSVGGVSLDQEGRMTATSLATVEAIRKPPVNQADVEKGVSRLAKRLVGAKLAPALVSAWRDVDIALRIWPTNGDMNHHLYPFYSVLGDRWLVRPIVPVPARLTAAEKAYFSRHRHGSRDERFEDSFFISESVENYTVDEFRWPLADYNTMLLYTDRAKRTLDDCLEAAEAGPPQEALGRRYARVAALAAIWRTQRNVLACGSIIEYVTGERKDDFLPDAPHWKRRFLEGLDDEIANTRELIDLMDESPETLITTAPEESSFQLPENLPELLERKISLMRSHRDDTELLFPGVADDDFSPETYEDIDKELEAQGK